MKRALVLFGNEENTENLIQSCLYFRDKFGYQLSGIFISDIRSETIIPQGFDGMIYDSNRALMTEEWVNFEQDEIASITKKLKQDRAAIEVTHEIGIVGETIREKMKTFDILILGKGAVASDALIEILKNIYKPLIIVGEKKLDFKKVYIANDDGVKANRSVYNFMNIFTGIDTFTSVTLNDPDAEKNLLNGYLADKGMKLEIVTLPDKERVIEYLTDEAKDGVVIMGNLSRSYLFERVAKKGGLKILEGTKMGLFIG